MLNKVFLQGRLCGEPEAYQMPNGVNRVKFITAVEQDYKGANGERNTDFIPCVAWSKTAEFIQKYFHRGDSITIVGQLNSHNFIDKDQKQRISYEVTIDHAYFGSR